MFSQFAFFIASSPGQRANALGKIGVDIVKVIAILTLLAVIIGLAGWIFTAAWRHAPWFVILWGVSGPPILIMAYIYAIRTLYFVGGIDLGVFLFMWFIAAMGGEIDG